MKREKKLTKKERKALKPARPDAGGGQHIHCVACGRHLDLPEFRGGTSVWLTCQHGSKFASCAACAETSKGLLEEHDRTGRPVAAAGAWH